jgi:nitronate monooxygenase
VRDRVPTLPGEWHPSDPPSRARRPPLHGDRRHASLQREGRARPGQPIHARPLDHRDAPAAYPEINNATRPLRAAAASAGDSSRLHLWAGEGYRSATNQPLATILGRLCGR